MADHELARADVGRSLAPVLATAPDHGASNEQMTRTSAPDPDLVPTPTPTPV